MSDIFSGDNGSVERDIDELQAQMASVPSSQLATVTSYDGFSQSGSARTASGSIVQFKNWTGNTLFANTSVLLLTKDSVNYVVATEKTVSGWASVQTVMYRPTNETIYLPTKSDVGKLVVTALTTGEVQVTVTHDLAMTPGQSIDFIRGSDAQVRFLAAGTPTQPVTLNATPGRRLQSQWSAATLICIAANTYVLVGDLKV
jgi:hypothetical protein